MPVSTEVKKEEQKLARPSDDYEMFSRQDFDQKQLRYEFAAPSDIAIDQETIKNEDKTIIDPRTLEMPVGPAGDHDDFASTGGMEEIVVEGEEWKTFVYNDGFTWHPDMDSTDSVGRQYQRVREMYHYLYDLNFWLGLDPDNDGNAEIPGMFDWIRSNIASDRVFDCSVYDGTEASDEADYSDVPEDLLRGDAMKAVRGRVLDINDGFDLMVGSHDAIMNFAGYSAGSTTDQERGPTFMERLEDSDTVQDAFRVPYKMQPDYLPRDLQNDDEIPDFMSFDFVDESTAADPSGTPVIGNDEVFLIPDVDTWVEEYVDLRESGSPKAYGPNEIRGGERAWDYKSRFGLQWDPDGKHPEVTDVVHLTNVSELFGPNN